MENDNKASMIEVDRPVNPIPYTKTEVVNRLEDLYPIGLNRKLRHYNGRDKPSGTGMRLRDCQIHAQKGCGKTISKITGYLAYPSKGQSKTDSRIYRKVKERRIGYTT